LGVNLAVRFAYCSGVFMSLEAAKIRGGILNSSQNG